jgi:hypothetical protein
MTWKVTGPFDHGRESHPWWYYILLYYIPWWIDADDVLVPIHVNGMTQTDQLIYIDLNGYADLP